MKNPSLTFKKIEQSAAANCELLDEVIRNKQLKNDAALARLLEVAPPVISKIRHGRLPIGPSMLLRIHEETDIPLAQLYQLLNAANDAQASAAA